MWRWIRRLVLYPVAALVVLVVGLLIFVGVANYGVQAPPQEGLLALTGATVLTGSELEPVEDAVVLVRDGVIEVAGAAGEVTIPPDTPIVDLSGATLLPGLIDAHVHMGMPQLPAGQSIGLRHYPGLILETMRHAPGMRRDFLEAGVTTVRSLGEDRTWAFELRDLIAVGELEGPRVFTAGPVITTRGGHPIVTIHGGRVSDPLSVPETPEAAREAVRTLATEDGGVDLIKVIQERGAPNFPLDPIPTDILAAVVDEAHRHGLSVVAHWGTEQDLFEVLEAGVDGLEHIDSRELVDGWPGGAVQAIIDAGLPLSPTLAVTEAALADRDPAIALSMQDRAGEFFAAGGTVTAGSDAAMPGVRYGGGLQRELELLVAAGLTPHEALRAATVVNADALGVDTIGVIEPGRAADLLAVGGDPLTDISRIHDVVAVWRDGRLVVDHRD